MKKFLFVISIGFTIACVRQAPQLPSNKLYVADSAGITLQIVNEKLIAGEDSVIDSFIATSGLDFEKSNSGLRYKVYSQKSRHDKPQSGKSCTLNYKVYSLDNKLLFSDIKSIIIGKKEIVNGIEETLLQLSAGDSAIAILPWYIGYGMKGDKNIPPYTSVLVHLQRIK